MLAMHPLNYTREFVFATHKISWQRKGQHMMAVAGQQPLIVYTSLHIANCSLRGWLQQGLGSRTVKIGYVIEERKS